jgi:hypothetical protein
MTESSTELFTGEWASRVGDIAGNLPGSDAGASVSLSLSCTIEGGPDGDIALAFRCRSGSLEVAVEVDNDADVTATIPWNEATAIARGELRPTVAYMRGKLKPSGNMEQCLRLLEATESEAFRSAVASL